MPLNDVSVSRLLWIVPVLLVLLMAHQGWVAYEVDKTWENGVATTAKVVNYEMKAMAAQTHGIITLRAPLPNGDSIEQTLSVPAMLAAQLRNFNEVPVRVLPEGGQEIVMAEVVRTQRRMALINVFISGIGALLVAIAIRLWQRYLGRETSTVADPA